MKKFVLLVILLLSTNSYALSKYYYNKDTYNCIKEQTHRIDLEKYIGPFDSSYSCNIFASKALKEELKYDKTKYAYWYTKEIDFIMFKVLTPYGYEYVYITEYAEHFSYSYDNIKNQVIKKACLEISKVNNKFSPTRMSNCLEYSSYEHKTFFKRKYCGTTYQNRDGTANKPSSCRYGANWSNNEIGN